MRRGIAYISLVTALAAASGAAAEPWAGVSLDPGCQGRLYPLDVSGALTRALQSAAPGVRAPQITVTNAFAQTLTITGGLKPSRQTTIVHIEAELTHEGSAVPLDSARQVSGSLPNDGKVLDGCSWVATSQAQALDVTLEALVTRAIRMVR